MKKKTIFILIAVLILAILAAVIIYQITIQNNKNYEIEQIKEYHYFILKQNDTYGVMDKKANILISPQYDEIIIPNPEKGIFICYQENNTKILNENGEEILTQYDNVQPIRLKNITSNLMYEKSVLKYTKDEKYGLVNLEGKKITKPIYDEIDSLPYKEGELMVRENEKYGIINIKGNQIIEISYDKIVTDEYYTDENRYQYAGYIVSIKTPEGYRYGYINHQGKELLNTEYNDISRVTEMKHDTTPYLICAKNGQYGIVKNGEKILENEYQSIRYDMSNQVFVVEKSKKYGIANLDGKIIVPLQYHQIDITGIYLYAQDEQGITVYNNDGTQANVNANMSILKTNNEKYNIKISNENGTTYGVINQEGKQLIEENYNYIEYLYDNYFIVSNEHGKLGVLDDKEAIKIDIKYDALQKIQGTDLIQTTLAETKTTQIYSKTMEKICEMQNATLEIEPDFIKIFNETETKYFSKEGKELKNTQVYPNNKLFVKAQNNQYGFVDSKGNLVVDYQYDKAYELNEYGFATIKKDGKWGSINEEGKEIVAPVYEIKTEKAPSFIGSYYRVTYGSGEFYYTDAK